MKKKKIILIVVICIGFFCYKISRLLPSYSNVLEANWGVNLPTKAICSEVYQKDSGTSFHGDGVRYHVFSYKYEDYVEPMFAWSPVEYETLFYSSFSEASEIWLNEIEVPEHERPSYTECFTWHCSKEDNSEIIFYWNADLNRIYIIENLI